MYKETLYGLEKGGKVKIWQIETRDLVDSWSTIVVTHGQLDGIMTEQVTDIAKGKQGRTVSEQAINEAKAKVKKQLDKNYRRTIEELTDLPLLPMLAVDYRKQGHRINWQDGVYVSDKLDGLRLLAKCVPSQRDIGKAIKLESRTGQPYSIPHIEQELLHIMNIGEVLDGEAYVHGECLEDITSAVKRTDTQAKIAAAERKLAKAMKAKDATAELVAKAELTEALLIHQIRPQLKFVIFDVPSDKPWNERLSDLVNVWMGNRLPLGDTFLDVVKYTLVYSEEEAKTLHRDAVARGYEGVMLRNLLGMYESGKRSADLQKYKEFLDAEFRVRGYKLDIEGQLVWICENDVNDLKFNVIFGTEIEKAAMLAEIEARVAAGLPWLVRALKVKFQKRYKKTLLPQFPTGVMFREGVFVNGEFIPDE